MKIFNKKMVGGFRFSVQLDTINAAEAVRVTPKAISLRFQESRRRCKVNVS